MRDVVVMAVVGAALVFVALTGVWAAIAVLVRLTAGWSGQPSDAGREDVSGAAGAPQVAGDDEALRAQAAGLAVAVALARWQADVADAGSMPVGAWQAATRSQRLQQRRPRVR